MMVLIQGSTFVVLFLVAFHNADASLIVANGSSIISIDLNSGNELTVLYDGLQRAVGVAVCVADNLLFWTDVDRRSIYRGSIDGQRTAQEIVTDLGRPNGIAVDWISNNIYWTDAIAGTIEVAKHDGSFRRTLLYSLDNPRGIAVDPVNGYMYWTSQDSRTVEIARMDGSNPQSLVNTGLYWPNEIVIDSGGKVYWIDGKYNTIESLQGSASSPVQVVDLSTTSEEVMFGLALNGQTLYFTVWTEGAVYSVSTYGTNIMSIASGFGDYVFGLAVSDASVQPGTSNGCTTQASCSQLCLPTGVNTRKCACSSYDELTLMPDGTTCGISNEFLLYCAGYDGQIRLLPLDGHASGRSIVIDQVARCVALDYDPIDQVIYYSDVSYQEIRRVDLSGSNSQMFLHQGIGIVDGIAIDVLHRRLYFTNWNVLYATNSGDEWARIEMVNLDGSNRKRIIESGLYHPRAIQLDVEAGYLYYSDWGVEAAIVRTDLDGQNPVVIHSQNVDNPNAIALTSSLMYFIDSHVTSNSPPTLESSNLDGTNRISISFPMKIPFGLDINNDMVYWSDWNETAIYKGNLISGVSEKLVDNILDPMAIKYATRTAPSSGQDRCQNSPCTDICVHAPAGNTRCVCPDKGGKVLNDNGFQCVAPSEFLLVADVIDIRMIGLTSSDRQAYPVVIATQDDNIVAIAYDQTSRNLYWSEVHFGTIQRVNFFTDVIPEVFYTEGETIDGMTIDSNTLYWTDIGKGSIEKKALDDIDGSSHEILLSNLSHPRAIDVHNEYLYFTEWTPNAAKVQRFNLNTQVLTTIIQGNLKKPNGLAISDNKLYVIDGEELIIIKSDLDGRNQEQVNYLRSAFNHAYGLDINGDSLIFSSWQDKAVYMTNVNNQRLQKIATNLNRPTEVVLQGQGQGVVRTTTAMPGPVSFRQCPDEQVEISVSEDSDEADLDVDIEAVDANGNIITHEVLGDIQIPGTLKFNDQTRNGIHIRVRAEHGQQEAWCEFQVVVIDPHPPKITVCPSDQSQTTSDDSVEIEWDPPVATDNTELASVTTSRPSGSDFTVIGSPHNVIVTATDTSDNTVTCSFDITIIHVPDECPDLLVPEHGALSCGNTEEGTQCVVLCKDGYKPLRNRDVYSCINGIWHPHQPPRCVRPAPGSLVSQVIVFIYQSACGLIAHKDEIITTLQANLERHELCRERNHRRVCDKDSFKVSCGAGNKRRKRQSSEDMKIEFKIQVNNEMSSAPSEDDVSLELLDSMNADMNETLVGIENLVKNGSLNFELNGQTITSDPDSFVASQPEWVCFEGHVSTVDGCVPCPVGTMYDTSLDECTFCPLGTYQTDEAQTVCQKCQDGEYTENIGSFRQSQCFINVSDDDDSSTLVIVIVCTIIVLLVVTVVIVVVVCLKARNKGGGPGNGNRNESSENPGPSISMEKLKENVYS
ncbi:low-density lipoprotein receptor-related protein 4-like isoform X2 [Ptychodera flava]|uniref:low-density lipoprotein receptor-related protein 4-like isoform X2 n=1 Tax=Ptychodera flava TaxID=63121 RepID=UPI00396A776E